MSPTLPRRIVGGAVLFLAIPLTPVVATAGFLATAFVTARVPVLAFAALAFGALAGGLLGRAAFALLGLERRRGLRASAFVAVGLTVAVAALGGVTVFRPMPTTAAAPPRPVSDSGICRPDRASPMSTPPPSARPGRHR